MMHDRGRNVDWLHKNTDINYVGDIDVDAIDERGAGTPSSMPLPLSTT